MFNCSTCKPEVMARRRCMDEREDFTEDDDGTTFPIYVARPGSLYGFCPAKATWEPEIVNLFKLLVIASETGAMMVEGGLAEQPDWWIDLLGWFVPLYDNVKFYSRAVAVFGDGKNKPPGAKG